MFIYINPRCPEVKKCVALHAVIRAGVCCQWSNSLIEQLCTLIGLWKGPANGATGKGLIEPLLLVRLLARVHFSMTLSRSLYHSQFWLNNPKNGKERLGLFWLSYRHNLACRREVEGSLSKVYLTIQFGTRFLVLCPIARTQVDKTKITHQQISGTPIL